MTEISLIDESGTLTTHQLRDNDLRPPASVPPTARIAYAAAHVIPERQATMCPVPQPISTGTPPWSFATTCGRGI